MKAIDKKNITDILPLTSMQEGMLFHYLKESGNREYFEQLKIYLSGPVDSPRFRDAWQQVTRVNELCRTLFRWEELERPVQIVLKEHTCNIICHDLSRYTPDQAQKRLKEIETEDKDKSFDLHQVPFRITLVKLQEQTHCMIISNHHILYDGWSNGILLKDFFKAYGGQQLLTKTKFKEFVHWQRGQDIAAQKKFWETYLVQMDTFTQLPLIPPQQGVVGAGSYEFGFTPQETHQLETFIKNEKITLAALLYAAWGVLLQRYNNSDDIVFGATVSGRPPVIPGIEDIVGLFINTLPFRVRTEPNETVSQLLQRIQQDLQNREPYQHTPLVQVKEYSSIDTKEELFNTILVLESYPLDQQLTDNASTLSVESYHMDERTPYELTLGIELTDHIQVQFSYSSKRFEPAAIERLALHFKAIIQTIPRQLDENVIGIPLLSPEEKQLLLQTWNDTAASYPHEKSVHQLFQEQAQRTPHRIVAVYPADDTYLTYRHLDTLSHRMAAYLQAKGIKTGDIVAVKLNQSLQLAISLFGILKAGAAYLPIDPQYPEERIAYMLRDSNAAFLLDEQQYRLNRSAPDAPVEIAAGGEQTAYVIYTSGTTGQPKGVPVPHRNVVNLLWGRLNVYRMDSTWRAMQLFSPSFDGFVAGFFTPPVCGACLILPGREEIKDVSRLIQIIVRQDIDHFVCVPPLYRAIAESITPFEARSLKRVAMGGDIIHPSLIQRTKEINPEIEVLNEYGVTECTVSSVIACHLEKSSLVTIGFPIPNAFILILDRYRRLMPIGIPGELCISGEGMAPGYLNRPELTSERFIKNDDSNPPYTTYYKTGDLARWLPDGRIQLLGRIDSQVKVRGFRVELGEIESRINSFPQVKQAVVVIKERMAQERYICAYIVPKEAAADIFTSLKQFLSKTLPDHMIPSYFVTMAHIPLTPNGKPDRNALPTPFTETMTHTPPRDETEKKVAQLFQELLNVSNAGIETDFFAIGGHSLKAMVLVSKISKLFKLKIDLNQIFQASTVQGIANTIKQAGGVRSSGIEPTEQKEYYPLSSAQKRLFFLDRFEDIGISYNMPALNTVEGEPDLEGFQRAFKRLIARHETLRTSFQYLGDMPIQQVHAEVPFQIETRRYAPHQVEEGTAGTLKPQLVEQLIRPFDLSQAPLFRAILLLPEKPGSNRAFLFFDMHHIISDGTSVGVLVNEFTSLYADQTLPPLQIQYRDFTQWQNRLIQEGEIRAQEEYWLNRFKGEIPRVNLPTDHERPPVFEFSGRRFRIALDTEETRRLKESCRQQGVTLFMNLLAAYNILLYRYTQQEDIIVGASIAGRRDHRLQPIIGMFVNALAMRNHPNGDESYSRFLQKVKQVCLEAYENQDLQFEALVEKLDPERDASRNPIFDVCLVVQNFNPIQTGVHGITLDAFGYQNETTKFDLTIFVYEPDDRIVLDIEYYTAIFEEDSIRRMAAHFINIIRSVTGNPELQTAHIDMLTPDEKYRLIETFNQTEATFPEDQPLYRLFKRQVEDHPNRVALSMNTPGGGHLTYKQLDDQSHRLALYLHRHHIQTPVALLLDNSPLTIIAMIGILKAGACYVPLDPSTPFQRIRMIIRDAAVELVISQKKYICALNRIQWECDTLHTFLCLDTHHVLHEEEQEKSSLMDEELWNYVGETAEDDITGGGWNSSYTGLPFSAREMQEYGDNVLTKLTPLLRPDMRVLEIGCASGLTMYRIAPKVGFYFGTDLSPVIIRKNRERVARQHIANISLAALPAHHIHELAERDFDLIIINSVIQSFHGLNYLRDVMRKCVGLLAQKGNIFCGDIMDQELKDNLIDDLENFKKTHPDQDYTTKTDWSTELFVSQAFFRDLLIEIPQISDYHFSGKIHTLQNELTRYRYDALLTVSKTADTSRKAKEKHKQQHDLNHLESVDGPPPVFKTDPSTPAYIIYTSGTTGRPKGVIIRHRSLVNYISWAIRSYIPEKDAPCTFPLYTTPAFDLTVTSIYVPLLSGGRVAIYPHDDGQNRFPLERILHEDQVDIIKATPSHLKLIRSSPHMGATNTRLKSLIVGGETLETLLADDIRQRFSHPVAIYNEYGPTEATVGCMIHRYHPHHDTRESVLIGTPAHNTSIYLLDSFLNPVPVNAIGEIYIGGIGLAQGYINLPQLTADKFLPNPFRPGQLIYASGDLGVRISDGNIRFLGRRDQQVKIRGYRIETEEIENKLCQHHHIREALILAKTDPQGDSYLCAYIIPLKGKEIEIAELSDYLALSLPEYMIPAYYAVIDKIPLTVNGKLDPAALPEPGGAVDTGNYIPPGDSLEHTLVSIWSDILNIPAAGIGIQDHFFRIGGHSLKATLMTARIHQELSVKVPLAEIFNQPTIRELARYIRSTHRDTFCPIQPVETREHYPLSFAQNRLYVLQRLNPDAIVYNMPGITTLQEITGSPTLSMERLNRTFRRLIQRHESLRTSFHMHDHQPVQRIADVVALEIETYSSRDQMQQFVRPFDLSQPPLLRIGIVTQGPHRNSVFIDIHHIISDDISFDILARDFHALYNNRPLPPLALQYKDFAVWQSGPAQKENILKQESFWLNQFSPPLSQLNLPLDFPRPQEFGFQGQALHFLVDAPLTQGLREIADTTGATLMMVLCSIFTILLSRFAGQEEVVLGIISAGRGHADLQTIIGFFINLLPLKSRPAPELPFTGFLSRFKETAVKSFDNQDYPFELLVEKLQVPRQPGRQPLIDVTFNMLETKDRPTADETGEPADENTFYKSSHFDLSLQAVDAGETLHMRFEYSTLLFKPETIRQLSQYYRDIVEQVVADNQIVIGDIKVSHRLKTIETVIIDDDADDWDL